MDDIQNFATKLFDFARNGDATLLEYIKQGVNVDMVNQDGQSFIMLAAYHGHAELVRQLAAAGADVNLLNDRGQSPLAGAIFKKEDAVIDALLDAGRPVRAVVRSEGSGRAQALAARGVELAVADMGSG